ncbi:MAG TPA: S9 family peptidase [Cyclobacteriaceae bacterium]
MKKIFLLLIASCSFQILLAQSALTPQQLWSLGRVSGLGLSKDGKSVLYRVSTSNLSENKSSSKMYSMPIQGGASTEVSDLSDLMPNSRISPDGKFQLSNKEVKINKVHGNEIYPDLPKSNVQIYDDLNYRHWDEWEDGSYSHIFYDPIINGQPREGKDIMAGEPYDCPQKPFGSDEDFIWSPDSKNILYVTKKKVGKAYAISTNTDIYSYNIETGKTTNLTEGMVGYDIQPAYSSTGTLGWLSMRRDGYESDKNDIVIKTEANNINLTKDWDGTVNSFVWSNDGKKIFFIAPVDGTTQLFEINNPGAKNQALLQLTKGDFDITGVVGQTANTVVVTRTDMNHAAEIYALDLGNKKIQQLTHVNDVAYTGIEKSKIERRYVTTTDGKKMLVWVIYPPNFDATKKYPTLLYCQGGPQSALTQFYSYRWNFQLMAAQGYIVVAPNRRGMPGFGVEWNEQISNDYGGQVMRDYLTAIDEVAKEDFVDNSRLGCVGASFGGYSVFYLAGNHDGRFKTFISHDGIFDMKSMYGTTEELWFVNWDNGGAYWDSNDAAQKSYNDFNPMNHVNKWDTPILIIQGGKDYRVPIGQGLEAFQAAQLNGIKSKLIYLPEENHWVLSAQNAMVWQHEFFKWLDDTLK